MSGVLDGKIALVTGGGTGIGYAIAKKFVSEGAFVFITGRRKSELDKTVSDIGKNVAAIQCDVSSLASIDQLYAGIVSQKGALDILVANAGVSEMVPLSEITEEHYYKTFDTNVKGLIFTVKGSLPLLNDLASIILIGSTTAIKGAASYSVYSASKAAVRNLARTWILELKERNTRVNVISPGPIETDMSLGTTLPSTGQSILDFLKPSIPLGRAGNPDEVAQTALFLASEQASFVNGVELFVDGGFAQY